MANSKATIRGELMFPSDYLCAVEFQGKDVTLTVKAVEMKDLQIKGGRTERKPVVMFDETPKMLVLNKTNASTIVDIHGSEADAWTGKRITLYPTEVQFGPETMEGIRVRTNDPGPRSNNQNGDS